MTNEEEYYEEEDSQDILPDGSVGIYYYMLPDDTISVNVGMTEFSEETVERLALLYVTFNNPAILNNLNKTIQDMFEDNDEDGSLSHFFTKRLEAYTEAALSIERETKKKSENNKTSPIMKPTDLFM